MSLSPKHLEDMPDGPIISFGRSDLEKRFLFPAGKFTNAGSVMSLVLASLATVALYGLLSLAPSSPYRNIFTERGPVPYVIVFMTFWALSILLIKHGKLRLQRATLDLRILPKHDPGFVITPSSAEQVLERICRSVDDPQKFYLTRRIHDALGNLKNMGRIGDVDEILRTQADNDEGQVEGSYTLLRGFVWAIPVLGFIGTVLGLSTALGSFGSVLDSAENMDRMRDALRSVTGGLSTAFETTLLGLVAALAIHMLMIFLQNQEQQFLDDCKDYSRKYIVGRLRLVQETAS